MMKNNMYNNNNNNNTNVTFFQKNAIHLYLIHCIVASIIFQISIGPYIRSIIYGTDDDKETFAITGIGGRSVSKQTSDTSTTIRNNHGPPPSHKFRPVTPTSPAYPYCLRRMNRLQQQQQGGGSGATIDQSSSSTTTTTTTSNYDMNCYEPTEMRGYWHVRTDDDPPIAVPICCSFDFGPGYFLENTKYCGTTYISTNWYTGRDDGYYQQTGGHGCTCQTEQRNFDEKWIWKFDEYHDYEYEEYTEYQQKQKQRGQMRKQQQQQQQEQHIDDIPSSAFQIFDPHLTCSLLGSRTVLMTGDSTMQQTASTLMNSLIDGNCSNQLSFVIGDTLYDDPSDGTTHRGYHFATTFASMRPDIVVYSLGAHIHQEDEWQHLFDTLVDNVTITLQNQFPDTLFVYKTHQPGGCMENPNLIDLPDVHAKQFNEYMIEHVKEQERQRVPFENARLYYNYGTFYGRDLYAMGRLWDRPQPSVLDVRMLYNRGDAHIGGRDCLHLCSPGPLDVIPLLFQRLLLKHKQNKN